MDGPAFDQSDIERLSTQEKLELQKFISNEHQKARIHQRTHDLTQTCWNKCVPGSIKGNTLDKGEETCLANCVDRFMDVSTLAVKHLQNR